MIDEKIMSNICGKCSVHDMIIKTHQLCTVRNAHERNAYIESGGM